LFDFGTTGLGESFGDNSTRDYSVLQPALLALAPNNTVQASAYTLALLPNVEPADFQIGSSTFILIRRPLLAALGISPGTLAQNSVVISNSASLDYTHTDGLLCSGSTYSLWAVLAHEVSEVLGRLSNVGQQSSGSFGASTLDMFTWASAGTRNCTNSGARYLSADGGTTHIYSGVNFNNSGPDDYGDLSASLGAFNAVGSSGVAFAVVGGASGSTLKAADWQFMTLIGWPLTVAGSIAAGLSSATRGLMQLGH
jgi:hypothetical protein